MLFRIYGKSEIISLMTQSELIEKINTLFAEKEIVDEQLRIAQFFLQAGEKESENSEW